VMISLNFKHCLDNMHNKIQWWISCRKFHIPTKLSFSNGAIWLTNHSWLMRMYILTKSLKVEWHVYFLTSEFDNDDLFEYWLNWLSNQVEPKTNHLNKKWPMGFS
jgi:hypothetical protein